MAGLHDQILILGCGCFGVSTAYHLLKRGYTNITILERSPVVPAPDAASNDINRIVRSSYSDRFYSELARDAISLWKNQEEWGDSYQESGVIVLGFPEGSPDASIPGEVVESYGLESYNNDLAIGANVTLLEMGGAIRSIFPSSTPVASLTGKSGYLNRDGGWVDAGKGLKKLIEKVAKMGAKILTSKEVRELLKDDSGFRTTGVRCADGSQYSADLVVLALGSWTPSTFPGLSVKGECLATGQCVAMIQLTADEAEAYRGCPVVLDFNTGFYVFPANENNIVKMAIHSVGYTHTKNSVSTPRTVSSDGQNGLAVPKQDLQQLRERLRELYPELAKKPFSATRLCWYNDSPDGDWIISKYPGDAGLVLATAGSGHAYKFLPNIGGLVADLIQDQLPASLVRKFAVSRPQSKADLSRKGFTQELPLDQLCTPADLSVQRGVNYDSKDMTERKFKEPK